MGGQHKGFSSILQVTCTLAILAFATQGSAASRVFYDGFESSTEKWQQDDYRNRCRVVSTSSDGIAGTYKGNGMASCNWNGAAAWNDAAAYETLKLTVPSTANEVFYRFRVRLDSDVDRTSGSAAKFARIYVRTPSTNDMFASARTSSGGCTIEGLIGGNQLPTYWGGASGDNTCNSSSWHEIEYYFNKTSGTIRMWSDGALTRDVSGINFNSTPANEFFLTSNFAATHDSSNHVYFDEVEVFTETGATATGSMASGTIADATNEGIPEPPQDVSVQ